MAAMRTDVLVIGGGPAGLATAIAVRLKGFEATVVDADRPPIDKACGEGIPPAGVAMLQRLGVRLSSDDALPFRGIRFLDGAASAEAKFPFGPGLALRRTRLHQLLVDRASELGVQLLWGTRLGDPTIPRSDWVVGADGQNSSVRRAAGLDAATQESSRYGFRRHYRISPWTDFVEVHWGSRYQIYVTPVRDDEVGIALLSRDPHLRLDSALCGFPDLQRRLRSAQASSTERGALTVSRRLRHVFRGRTLLVGDASGSVDAITGEGLSLSFHQAVALSEALCHGELASYQAEHSRLARRPALLARALFCLDRFPSLRKGILTMLALEPAVFSKLLTIYVPEVA